MIRRPCAAATMRAAFDAIRLGKPIWLIASVSIELRLLHRRDDLDHRLVLEERRAFRHCVDVAGEAEFCEPLQDRVGKALRSQIGEVGFVEAQRLDRLQEILEPGGDRGNSAPPEGAARTG